MMRTRVDVGNGITVVLGRTRGCYRITEICITDPDSAKLRGIRIRQLKALVREFGKGEDRK